MTTAVLLALICIAATGALLWAEFRHSQSARSVFKLVASTAFVAIALQLGAPSTGYGRGILIALALSWIGDMLLLSGRSRVFLCGLLAFLLAHLAFAIAFLRCPLDARVMGIVLVSMGVAGMGVLRWLWPRLRRFYRPAVSVYVAAIVAMSAVAFSVSVATGTWQIAAGALLFAISDIAVARNRFVSRGPANKAWGLPLYYAAQILLAMSVASAPAMH